MRSQSLLAPDKRYNSGQPCKRGHIGVRFTANHACVECSRLAVNRHAAKQRGSVEWWASRRCANIKAKEHGVKFTITPSDVLVCIPLDHHCPVLDIKMDFSLKTRADNSPSIDRMVPSLGYIPGNIQVISWRANNLKRDVINPDELQKVVDFMRKSNAPISSHQRPAESRVLVAGGDPSSEPSLPC